MSFHVPLHDPAGPAAPFPGGGPPGRAPTSPPVPSPAAAGWTAAGMFDTIGRWFRAGGEPGGKRQPQSPAGPQVYLAGFGKHPGAGDHDDIGVDTEELSYVKRTLYTNGIGGNIDKGEWDKLPADERVEQFGHEFLWDRQRHSFYGRLWASRDAKGRTKYPMVVVAQCGGVPREWILSAVPPVLARAEQAAWAATSAAELHQVLEGMQAELRASAAAAVAAAGGAGAAAGGGRAFQRPYDFLTKHPDLGPDARGLLRLMYEVEKEMVGFRPGDDQRAQTTIIRLSGKIRVPACGLSPARSVDLWVAALRPLLYPATSILAVRPLAHDWVDLIVGEPGRNELYPLLAGRKRVALVTEVPYSLTPEFVAKARQTIAAQR